MAKKKKTNLSELISKRGSVKKSINPFEVHINRQKFNVLNRKLKEDRGLPGVARAKAIKKRKETLLQEYKVLNKNNKFFDRRLGERNSAMTKEDRIIARFSAERMKSMKRKEIFNLADDEVLTHKGQSIAEIDKLEDPLSDDEGDVKGLDAKFVEGANFGGGILKESKANRASIIEQLIEESKKRKIERQLAKEKTLKKTEELDAEWKELIPIVNMGRHDEEIEKKDSYDKILNDLKFEPRGTPSNKLKTEAEIAAEEARKLKELEEERLRRMRGEDPDDIKHPKIQHRSADDLDDGFELEEEDNFELRYDKDGEAIGLDKFAAGKKESANVNESDNDESESEDEEEEGNGSEEEEGNGSGEEEGAENDNVENENEDEEGKVGSDSEAESDDFSDLKVKPETEKNEDSEVEDNIEPMPSVKGSNDSPMIEESTMEKNVNNTSDDTNIDQTNGELRETSKLNVKDKKKVSFGKNVIIMEHIIVPTKTPEELEMEKEKRLKDMEKARKELPYAFEVPATYEELQELFNEKSLDQQSVIIQRMIKCNHPSLSNKNKEKLENLFAILMQHLNDCEPSASWALLDRLAPYLFDLTQFSPCNSAYCLSEVILEKHSDYNKKKNKYPPSETFLFLKLVPLLFPTSDKRHCVTTPAYVFISEMLRQCQVTTRRAISSGLFLVTLFIEYVSFSKRIMPEVFNFLRGVIHLATPSTSLPVIPPFKKEHKFLFLHKSYSDQNDMNLSMGGSDLEPVPGRKIDDVFRIKSIYCALKLTQVLAHTYEGLPASKLLIGPIKKHLDTLEINKYPEAVQKAYTQLNAVLELNMNKRLEPITIEAKKPKALRLYEPSIKPVYDLKKKNLPPEEAEHSKLLSKYRKEMKGALREIRRDREFISKVKFKEQTRSDAERKRKVKEIYAWGAQQEGEFKKMKKKK